MKCHYEILGVERTAEAKEIKRAYRERALAWHPDKNPDEEEKYAEMFTRLQQAYEVLNDPAQRKWYDGHRDQILRAANYERQVDDDTTPSLWAYFNASCFTDQEDFRRVYATAFQSVWDAEPAERRNGKKNKNKPPPIGTADASYSQLRRFYDFWKGFNTTLSFNWEDIDTTDAPNRDTRRYWEKKSKKKRAAARGAYVEHVRELASFAEMFDERISKYREERAEKERIAAEERAAQLEKEKAEMKILKEEARARAAEYLEEEIPEEYWEQIESRYGDAEYSSEEEDEEEEPVDLYCIACRKKFKNEATLFNHFPSKKHKLNVAKLKRNVLMPGEPIPEALQRQEARAKEALANPNKPKRGKKTKKKAPAGDDVAEEDVVGEVVVEGEFFVKKVTQTKAAQNVPKKKKSANKKPQDEEVHENSPVEEDPSTQVNGIRALLDAILFDPPKDPDETAEEAPPAKVEKYVSSKKKKNRKKSSKNKQKANQTRCGVCYEQFPSRTALFKHIEAEGHAKPM